MDTVKVIKRECFSCICSYCNNNSCVKKIWCEMKPCGRTSPYCTGHGECNIPNKFQILKEYFKGVKKDESK